MDLLAAFKAEAYDVLQAALKAVAPDADMPSLETPPDPSMGDLGMPCFGLAKVLRKAPPAIAEDVAAAAQAGGWIAEVAAVGPYVNVRLDRQRLAGALLADPEAGLSAEPRPGKILLEHTSANPNGPLHVGRARNPILGDTLARLHRAAGYEVETQYYMDDLGRQVAQLYWGKQNIPASELPQAARDKPDHDLVRYYQVANERREADPDVAAQIKGLVAELEEAPKDLVADVAQVYMACFDGMRQSLERLGVHHDAIKNESDLVISGDVGRVIAELKKSPRAGDDDGANYLDLSDLLEGNKSTKFFFTRADGTSVYATRDVAYHAWKARQVGKQGRLLNVLGEDHRLQSLQVGVALEELGHPRPDVAFYAFVSLPEGKMSTRANRVVFLDDLMDEAVARAFEAVKERRGHELPEGDLEVIAEAVGIAALRFNIVRVQPEKPIKFRWEDALDFDGDSAPYIMYAATRAASLRNKAAAHGMDASAADPSLVGDGEAALLATAARLPGVALEAADALAPHRFCAYTLELAGAFNEYYRDHPVVACDDPALAALRLRVVEVAHDALNKCLQTLGLPVLARM